MNILQSMCAFKKKIGMCVYLAVIHSDVFGCGPRVHLSQQLLHFLQHGHLQRLVLSWKKAGLVPGK